MPFLFLFFCSFWASEALSNDMRICKDVSELQKASSKIQQADPAATKQLMSTLSQRIKRVRGFNTPSAVVSHSDALGAISTALDRAGKQSNTSALLVANLSSLRKDLEVLTVIFGCEFVEVTTAGSEVKPLGIRQAPSVGQADKESRDVSEKLVLGGGIMAALMALAAIFARFGLHDRSQREVCNTPVLVIINDGCTVTRIVDINRNGMKIEAAPVHAQEDWVELYFCGHNCHGKIKWKNEYFAGIRFQKRLSQAAVADVIEKSQAPLESSDLEKNATQCFSYGCHEDCRKHCLSAMAERVAEVRG